MSPSELESLWIQHAARLRLLIQVRTEYSEDCVQEAFIRLSQQAKIPEDPVAWLAKVARNLALTAMRTDRRRKQRETEKARLKNSWFTEASQSAGCHHPSDIEAALQQLPVELRELVIAIIWNKMTIRQAAEIFSMAPATAHRRYREALQQIGLILTTKTQDSPPSIIAKSATSEAK